MSETGEMNGFTARWGSSEDQLPKLDCTEKVTAAVYTHQDGDVFLVPGLWFVGEAGAEEARVAAGIFGIVTGCGKPEWREFGFDPKQQVVSVQGVRGSLDSPELGKVDVIVIEGAAFEQAKRVERGEAEAGPAREDSPWKRCGGGQEGSSGQG